MPLSLIVALDKNGLIGVRNGLPWRLPADLKHFKESTMGKSIIMGRLTCESLGRPLPGRRNIVLTANPGFAPTGFEVFHSVDAILDAVKGEEEPMVIGGAKIYNLFWPNIKRAYVTLVDGDFEGDTRFPEWPLSERDWHLVSAEKMAPDARNAHSMAFMLYEKMD